MAVRQKSKKDPITVEADWEWRDQGPTHLLVRASLDDWKRLISFPQMERWAFFNSIYNEAKAKVETSARNLPRGLLKEEFDFIQKMKIIALFTSDIIRSQKSHGDTGFYRRLVEKCGQKIQGYRGKKRDPKIHELTAFVLDHIFDEEKKKNLIRRRWAKNPDNFRKTYLDWWRTYKEQSAFHFMIHGTVISNEFNRYVERSKDPLKAFELFFKEKPYLMSRSDIIPIDK